MATDTRSNPRANLWALIALGFGAFVISTSEFASMGLLPLFADDLGLSLPNATHGITAYALGVTLGAPLLTIGAARLNKRVLLIWLMVLACASNVLTAFSGGLGSLIVGRFASGLPQGAYFGAATVAAMQMVGRDRGGWAVALVMSGISVATIGGAPMGTFIGQLFDWRVSYAVIAVLGLASALALLKLVPHSHDLDGGPVAQEMAALKRGPVWLLLAFASVAVASLFSVYTFIGPLVTQVAGLSDMMIAPAQMLVGLGIFVGTLIGGRAADRYRFGAMLVAFAGAMAVLILMALTAQSPGILLPTFFLLGATINSAVPSVTVQLMRLAPEAPTLMGAMNMAAFNLANAIGAAAGGLTVDAGLGIVSSIWAGLALTGGALTFFVAVSGKLRSGVGAGQPAE
ncbi:MFS transporter [bacterium]|nr:MFS transporter [bacterium]